MLNKKIQDNRLAEAISAAGKRYDTTVNLRVQTMYDHLHAVNRDEKYISDILRLVYKLKRDKYLNWAIEQYPKRLELSEIRKDLLIVTDRLFSLKGLDKNSKIIWSILLKRLDNAASKLYTQYSEIREIEEKRKKAPDDSRFVANDLWRLYGRMRDLSDFLTDENTELFNKPRLMIRGEAGIGKTHLLCDYAKERIENGKPTLIFLSHELLNYGGKNDPVDHMAKLLGLKSKSELISSLKKLSKSNKDRVCVIVDAINEADTLNWQRLSELYGLDGVSLVVSFRNGYEFLINDSNKYTYVQHSGFAEMEWDAIPVFFKQYGLKLPEIPIIDPEFKNPLFLRIFCTAYSKQKKTPRGKGATDAFEQYIEHQSSAVLKELGLKLPDDYLWNNVIKAMGVWMGKNGKDRVLKRKLYEIIGKDKVLKPHIVQLTVLMERYGLIIKSPHYANGKRGGYSYRFTYNRFSDHLIVRSILTENDIQGVHASLKAKKFFENNSFLSRTMQNWNEGLIEALAVQIPERCKGDELVWLVPEIYRDHQIMKSAFIEGLKWRDVSSIDKKTGNLKFINTKQVLKYMNLEFRSTEADTHQIFSTMLDVCAIPGHPFNSDRLHTYLNSYKLGKRDSWWQKFLYYETSETGNAISRIHSWSFSALSNQASEESVLLASVALSWTLASTDRNLRDFSTRSLVALLQNNQGAILSLLADYFPDCNDPYITERLYCSAYGALSLNPNEKDTFRKIAEYIYREYFLNETRTPNALIDDYAKGIIELYLRNYENDIGIQLTKITPPFDYYKYPKRIPTVKTLKSKYTDEDDRYYSIWGSLMYGEGGSLADFGNYTLGAALSGFSDVPIGSTLDLKDQQRFNKFMKSLSVKQKKLYDQYNMVKFNYSVNPIFYANKREETYQENKIEVTNSDVMKALRQFVKSLGPLKRYRYKKLKKYIVDGKPLPSAKERHFDPNIARRWVFSRVIQLGWTPEDHLEYDRARGSYDRLQSSSAERIGKKYQWIGLFEFVALMGSKYYFINDDVWREEKLIVYSGAYLNNLRDIDPTIDPRWLVKRNNTKQTSDTWWIPEYSSWNIKDWKFSTDDIPKPRDIIQVKKDGVEYLNLYSRMSWKGEKDHPEDEDSHSYPELWMFITGYVIRKEDLEFVKNWSKEKEFWNNALPDINDHSGTIFAKELINSSAYSETYWPQGDSSGWVNKETESNSFDILPPLEAYSSSYFDNDKTITEPVRFFVPTGYLRDKMHLHHSKEMGQYVSDDGKVILFDPSINSQPGSETVLVNKNEFLSKLNELKLVLCWTILGEKIYMGNNDYRGQRLEVHGFGYFDDDNKYVENIRFKNQWSEESND